MQKKTTWAPSLFWVSRSKRAVKSVGLDQADRLQVTAQIPLTIGLAERYLADKIAGLTPDAVIPYLQENLHWQVSMADGSEVPRGDVQNLVVSVVRNEVTIPENLDELPIYAPSVGIYPEITTK